MREKYNRFKNLKSILYIVLIIFLNTINLNSKDNEYIEAIPRDRAVDVYWTIPNFDSSLYDLTGFYLYRSINKDGPYSLVTPTLFPLNKDKWYDEKKINRVTYYYKLRSIDDVGNLSELSPFIAEATPRGDETSPTPVILGSKVNGSFVELYWTPSEDDVGIDHYNVYRSMTEVKDEHLSSGRKDMPALHKVLIKINGDTLKFNDETAKPGTVYYYNVTAVDTSENESKASNNISIRIPGKDVTPPFIESVSDDTYRKPKKADKEITVVLVGEAKLKATYTLGNYVVNQPMRETAKPGTYFAIYTVKPEDKSDTSIPITGYLLDPSGNKSEKKSPNTAVIDTLPPKAVSDFVVANGYDTTRNSKKLYKADLSWAISSDAEAYKIYRHTETLTQKNIKDAQVLAKHLEKNATKYRDLSVKPNKTYFYVMSALDSAENEALSQAVEVKTIADVDPPKIAKIIEDSLGVTKKTGNNIKIVLYGEQDCTATFNIGTKILNIPMEETLIGSIHTGTYYCNYVVKENDDIENVVITGKLVDASGNETKQDTKTLVTIRTHSTDIIPPEIIKVSHDRKGYVLVEGEVLKVTMTGDADCIGFFDIGPMIKGIKLLQVENGIYEGTYRVEAGDNIGNAQIIGYLADSSGNVSTSIAEDLLTIDTSVKIQMSKDRTDEYLTADSTQVVKINAQVTDAHGIPMGSRKIDFSLISNYGSVTTLNGITDEHGNANCEYKVGMVVQTAYICAEDVETGIAGIIYVKTAKSAECQIELRSLKRRYRWSNGQYYIDMEAHPQRITADGNSVSIITTTVRKIGQSGVPGPLKKEETDLNKNTDERIAGEKVKFTITTSPEGSSGTLRIHPKYLDVEADGALTDANGEAKAIYTAGTKIGMTIIHSVVPLSKDKGEPIADMIGIVLIAGEVRYLTIIANPALLDADGASQSIITVSAEDSFNNPCEDVEVDLEVVGSNSNFGTIEGETSIRKKTKTRDFTDYVTANNITKEVGKVVVKYTAGTVPTKVTIKATVYSSTPIDDGIVQYAAKNYVLAIDFFKKAIQDYPEDNWSDDVNYILGYSQELVCQYDDSINCYNEVVRYYFGGPWADNALYRIGQVYEKKTDYAKAIDSYKELIDKAYLLESKEVYKNNLIDNAIFRLGIMYERLEHYQMAKDTYLDLIDRFTNTDETSLLDDSEKALNRLREKGY